MTPSDYENLVCTLLKKNLPPGTVVEKLKVFKGKDTNHEIDLSYTLEVMGVNYLNLVECKLWSRRVGKREMQAFFTTINDIGANKGIFVTSVGFQSGAIEIAQKNGIALIKLTNEHPIFDIQHNIGGGLLDRLKSLGGKRKVNLSLPTYLVGTVETEDRVRDYIVSNYGAECAEFLFSDEIIWLKDMEDSILKSTIESQILAIPNNWQRDFWNVETGGLTCTVVEPEVKLRIMNLRIMEEKKNAT